MLLQKQNHLLNSKFLLATVTAFDNTSTGGWKMNADSTAIEVKDGHPVFVGADGKESVVQFDTISRLNGEAKTHRTAKEAAEAKLKDFEGIDAAKARKALEDMSKIDMNKMIDTGKVDELKNQITSQFTAQIGEKDKAYGSLQGKYENMLVNNIFANSEFVRNNLAIPRDMFEAYFRGNFKVEGDKVTAYAKDGNQLMSQKNIGEVATPEEALQILVNMHPQKDVILKAEAAAGSGSNGGGGNSGAGRIIKRADLDKMTPVKSAEMMVKVRAGEIKLVD